jgi:hypothetical protein
MPQVVVHLRAQRPLDHLRRHLIEQPARAIQQGTPASRASAIIRQKKRTGGLAEGVARAGLEDVVLSAENAAVKRLADVASDGQNRSLFPPPAPEEPNARPTA